MTSVSIDRLAAGGDGIGRLPNGMAVFVPRTAPGDLAEVEVLVEKRRFARAALVSIESAGAGRATPKCVHYARDYCGGCQLQHVTEEVQLEAKRRIVGDALRRIGKLAVADPEIVPSVAPWRYRNKISLTARGVGEKRTIGLHSYNVPQTVFEPDDCLITRERVMQLWLTIRACRDLLPATLEKLVLREDREGGLHVIVSGGTEPWDARPLANAVASPKISFWWQPSDGAARIVAGSKTGFPPMAFRQSNPDLADKIREEAVRVLNVSQGDVVWDLYGGVGDTAAPLADLGADVWLVDADRAAVEWGERNNGEVERAGRIRYLTGRVEESLHRLPQPVGVIVNPPRRGLVSTVAAWLERWARGGPDRRLAYISCDPATLGRDLVRMPSLVLDRVIAFDLFPQTSHVETLAGLESK